MSNPRDTNRKLLKLGDYVTFGTKHKMYVGRIEQMRYEHYSGYECYVSWPNNLITFGWISSKELIRLPKVKKLRYQILMVKQLEGFRIYDERQIREKN
jgi:hypothetical protein